MRYLPYGAIHLESGRFPTDRLYTGQRWDSALGLYDYRARTYDPVLGRFISADPIVSSPSHPQALNRYAYVLNNPIRHTDPSGYCIPGVNCPGMVSGIAYPGDTTKNLRGEAYAAWLTHYILWQEQQRAETGGMLDIELGQKAAAFELSSFLMKDPELLGDILYQQVAAAAPQITAQAAGAATDILISGAGWALGMVRPAACLDPNALGRAGEEAAGSTERAFAPGKWLPHFEKHGAEFGYKTPIEYLRGAQRLTAGGEGIQTFVRANGDTLFYNPSTNEFAVLSKENIIRTYFKPIEGLLYWLRQTGRR